MLTAADEIIILYVHDSSENNRKDLYIFEEDDPVILCSSVFCV